MGEGERVGISGRSTPGAMLACVLPGANVELTWATANWARGGLTDVCGQVAYGKRGSWGSLGPHSSWDG